MSFKIFRTSKTRVTNLSGFKNEPPRSGEQELKKDEVDVVESSAGEAFQEIFGEAGYEVPPEEVNKPGRHVRKDDEPDDESLEEEPPKRKYSGRLVEEGVNPSKTNEVESADLDDLISAAMGGDEPNEADKKRSTSTPTKDEADVDNADFGGFISMIRDDNGPPSSVDDRKDEPRDNPRDVPRDIEGDRKRWSVDKPSSGSKTTTTTSYSFSSKYVPNIPASFYKDIQTKLEDLIFKFECLDNEYAALQKISHKVYIETMDIKKIFTNEN